MLKSSEVFPEFEITINISFFPIWPISPWDAPVGSTKKLGIPITTFMIAQDPYLQQFVREFTNANSGKAFFTGLKGLGEIIFEDYEKNRKKKFS